MYNIAILDLLWGDSGKGRVAHYFSSQGQHDWIIRVSGGNNCGHVIYRDGKKFVHNFLPSSDYRNFNSKSFLASGMVIHPESLLKEILEAENNFPGIAKTIYIDPDAFVITDSHITIDKETNSHIGSTKKGIQPAYTDKVARKGTRIYNLIRDNNEYICRLKQLGVNFNSVLSLKEIFLRSNLLFEGAQGILLDLNAGLEYPYVTSSDATVSGIYAAGFNFIKLNKVYGLLKGGYSTKVGEGSFVAELFGEDAEKIRKDGNEYGSVTSRPRRIGALDLVAAKYAAHRGGIDSLFLTKLDVLNGYDKIKVCVDYGKNIYSPADFYDIKPSFIELNGWKNAKNIKEILPLIEYIENFVGLSVEYYSCGVNDEDIIKVK